ncbi:MAG: UDP-N-acetylmuramoyl-L-alanyl-D-glutamate--2,6-diaminopimelate ligase [Chthonomonadaceae bacterium]|nr:UDP-N-acetylmuramoyl-L-alanyl-D-glutamate--2,6-diaminopimelate ligase [Chthonomonadaceae bacterium]
MALSTRARCSIGRLCREFYGDPSDDMSVVGVTGTNGKTTVAWMVRNALNQLDCPSAYLGTLGFQTTGVREVMDNTTPFPVKLWSLLSKAKSDGCSAVVMEASSHALFQRRLAGVSFEVGTFTNFTQDHLDFHGSMDAYRQAKLLLFTEYAAASKKEFAACLNLADPVGQAWSHELPCPTFTFGTSDAMVVADASDIQVDGLTLSLPGGQSARLRFGGDYNVENARAALATLVAMGFDADEALSALASVDPVPGRFEPIANTLGIGVLVDYAHTPDALTNLLKSVRKLRHGRVITVFGCGGDRDRTKRPKMATAASSLSDLIIVTSDNPRTEDPNSIIDEIVPGIGDGTQWERVTDRKEAIHHAIQAADPGDVVIIAGKGHEDYQIIGREKIFMSDQQMAQDALHEKSMVPR